MTVTAEDLKRLLEAFNHHDVAAIMDYFAEDCTLDVPRGPDPWGKRHLDKQQVRQAFASRFKGIPDVQYTDDRHWIAGERGCIGMDPDGHDDRRGQLNGSWMRSLGIPGRQNNPERFLLEDS